MQNIGLEMRKCVAGGQKMGLQTPNSTFRPGKREHIRRGGGRISTKEAARSEKAGANAARRGKKSAALHGGVRREVWFCGDRGVLRENLAIPYLIGELGEDVFAVQAGDVGDRFVLGADGFASTGVGAVTKSEFIHLGHHEFRTTCGFGATLGQEGELRYLGRNEEHSATILTSGHASAATDARGAVHGLIGVGFGDEDGVGVLSLSGADGGVTAGRLDFVESGAIDHAVLDNGEGR